jgi:iron complex outermembrane receptor protein
MNAKTWTSVLALAFWVAISGVAGAEDGLTVTGKVASRDDGQGLPGAKVSLGVTGPSAVTDGSGNYTLTLPATAAAGQQVELIASFEGLQSQNKTVTLASGATTADFSLGLSFHESITVGSRAGGTAAEQAVPVDVFSIEQLETTGASETNQVLQALAPSFNFPRPTITDGTDTVRPATLRGLGPDQVLVLVNGKRRHTSALVHVNNSIGRGSTGVDLNAIPASAIEKVEILRDGAAAQYGSDAISGVINLGLKGGDQPLEVRLKSGATTHGDGGLVDAAVSKGWNLGKGWLFTTLEYRDRSETNRAGDDPRPQGSVNPVPQPNHHWGDSDASDGMIFFNAGVPINDAQTTFFYSFGGASRREGSHGGFYRRALDARNQPTIYPDGFLPLIEPEVWDYSLTGGARGSARGWFWDLSTQYGYNTFDFTITNSLNASLGPSIPPNQTTFDSGGLRFGQWVSNFDLSRPLDLGLAGPINLGLGLEVRRENYQIVAGEPASYLDGGFPDQFGGKAAAGAQVFPGFRPSNEIDTSRTSYALYVDLEGDVLDRLRVGLAGRFEDYSDFGSTADGKLSLRFQATEDFVVRAAYSTGFRAPSLSQSFFSATSTNFLTDPATGQLVPFEVGTFPVNSPVARALGAKDLKPEESKHISLGFVWQATPAFQLSADYYSIDISDRIVFSGNFTGGQVATLLAPFGVNGARFFTNAIDTETEGYDFTASYDLDAGNAGNFNFSAGYNTTENRIVRVAATPPQLRGLEEVLFDRVERRRLECAQPDNNLRLTTDWRRDRLASVLRGSRYGKYCNFSSTPANDQDFSAEWLFDLEVSYRFDAFTVAVGGQNLFDAFPDENTAPNSFNGIFTYPSHSPFGMNGRFLYARIAYKF